MKKEMVGEKTYLVIDQVSNRFNFCGLVDVDELMQVEESSVKEYKLTEQLPADVKRAVDTMMDNDCEIEYFTGIMRAEKGDTTFYVLTW